MLSSSTCFFQLFQIVVISYRSRSQWLYIKCFLAVPQEYSNCDNVWKDKITKWWHLNAKGQLHCDINAFLTIAQRQNSETKRADCDHTAHFVKYWPAGESSSSPSQVKKEKRVASLLFVLSLLFSLHCGLRGFKKMYRAWRRKWLSQIQQEQSENYSGLFIINKEQRNEWQLQGVLRFHCVPFRLLCQKSMFEIEGKDRRKILATPT